jgi:hypothetical protein
MIELVKKYNTYVDELPILIKNSYFKAEYFIKNLECSEQTYYRKLRENSFTIKEIEKLTELLFPKEFYTMELKKEIEQGRNDFLNGDYITHDAMKRKI